VPCHTRVEEGQIFLNFSRAAEPPPFERLTKGGDFGEFAKKYGIANLKIAARRSYPIKGNWKLAIENFLECYHCGAAHKTLVTTHDFDYTLTQSQKKRRQSQISAWLGQETVEGSGQLNPGFESGSLDGKQLAPLLPNLKEPTRVTDRVDTYWSTGYWRSYDDYVAMARFTPRGPESTDAEIIWLVHPDAVEGKDYDPEKLMALWDITMREDAWLVENNHVGVKSGGYRAGHYSAREGWPSGFIDWYMNEVVKA
jgi:phenylpropionate dioxygenase-like ring-hydroxylating dioxygenase large terminal subunit